MHSNCFPPQSRELIEGRAKKFLVFAMFWYLMSETLQASCWRINTHACTRRRGPSSRWAMSRTRSRWGCCTEWTWRCGRYAPPPAEGDRGQVHLEFASYCTRVSKYLFFFFLLDVFMSDLQRRCPSSGAFSFQVWLPAALLRDTTRYCCYLIKT